MVRFRGLAAMLVLVGLSAGCSDNTGTTTTTPTPVSVTDTFSGALTQNAAATFQFTTLQAGTVTATISALTAPDASTPPTVGMSLGTWNGNACLAVISKDDATATSSVIGSVSTAGVLCVRIYDVGNITSSVTYTINVNHP